MGEEEITNAIRTIVTVGIPTLATIVTYFRQSRQNRRHAAKQSILQMIMEDQFNWELFKKFPVNYGNIQNEYEVYHNCGGNGEVTKKVQEYNEWYRRNESKMLEMDRYKCEPQVTLSCRRIDDDNYPSNATTKRRKATKAN